MLAFPDCFWFRLTHRGWFFAFSFLMLLMEEVFYNVLHGLFALCSASVFWVHLWHLQIAYMMLSVPSQTKYPKFRFIFFSQHASLCDTHCFYTTLLHLQPLGLILLAKSSEPEFKYLIPVTMHKKCLASTHCFEHWKWESGCLLRKILLPFSFLFNV